MSTPDLELDAAIRARPVTTDRGEFATFDCLSRMALPHGNALLIPGFTGSKEDFAALLPLLADVGWAVASYDQRGQYETLGAASGDHPAADYSLEGFADDAVAVADAMFGTSEQVHLVGHSFGGLVATTAVLRQPLRWASLTLLCSGPGGFAPGAQREELLAAAEIILRDGLEASYQAKRRHGTRTEASPPPPPPVEEFLHRRFLSNSPESLAAIARLLTSAPDRRADLAALDIPITVIRGAEDDGWPHDVQDDLAAALGTHVEVIEDAAHSPAVEQPEPTRDSLARAFLR